MPTAVRISLLVAVQLLTPGCVYFSRHTLRGACLTDMGSPVRNFCVAAPKTLWRGERPTREDATWLLKQRVGTVISLQLDDRRAFEGATLGPDYEHTVQYYQVHGFSPLQVLSPAHLDRHLAFFMAIVKTAPKPVFVHCRAGVDRTGVLVAAYRVLIDGVSPTEAIEEMGRFHSPWQSLDAHYIKGLSAARRAAILREAADWEPRLRPTGRFDCQRGRCAYAAAD